MVMANRYAGTCIECRRAVPAGAGTVRRERELTPELRTALSEAYAHMLDVCDGAETRDGLGFAKSDVGVAAAMLSGDVNDDDEVARAMLALLSRYHRQLSERWPVIFRAQARVEV